MLNLKMYADSIYLLATKMTEMKEMLQETTDMLAAWGLRWKAGSLEFLANTDIKEGDFEVMLNKEVRCSDPVKVKDRHRRRNEARGRAKEMEETLTRTRTRRRATTSTWRTMTKKARTRRRATTSAWRMMTKRRRRRRRAMTST